MRVCRCVLLDILDLAKNEWNELIQLYSKQTKWPKHAMGPEGAVVDYIYVFLLPSYVHILVITVPFFIRRMINNTL